MAEVSDLSDSDKTILYTFYFGASDKLVHLTKQALRCIPYLFNLVAHKDDFSSAQNENSEYVLNHSMQYAWLMATFHSMPFEQPCTLFNELPEDEYIQDVLELFDCLGIDSFSLHLLKNKTLLLSNPIEIDTDKKTHRISKGNYLRSMVDSCIVRHSSEYT